MFSRKGQRSRSQDVKTTQKRRRVYLRAADQVQAYTAPTANQAYAIIRPNLLSVPEHETLDNWRDAACDVGTRCRHPFLSDNMVVQRG